MDRTRLKDRILPNYTLGEERMNMISHIVGGAIGVVALVLCVVISALQGDAWGVVGGAIYGSSLILLYSVSSIYHGLRPGMGKKVMQVIDHCTIYFLIGGTYTPILLCSIRPVSPGWAWTLFGIVWGLAAMAATFTAIDLKKYGKLSMICYIGMGWCIVFKVPLLIQAVGWGGFWLILAGGLCYTAGAVLYGWGRTKKYMHSIFHLFVIAGSVLHLLAILIYVL